jgi:serine/threonine protein kinase
MALSPGTRLGRYEITGPLGAGGMGAVYRASDTSLRRDVAVKVLHDEFVTDPNRLRRFEREALATAALNHPHIIAVYDVGTHDGTAYVVSELLEGRTLQGILAMGPLPPARAAAYASQIALGLAAAHEKDIVHRDLKPANLFIAADDRVKILDFGIARVEHAAGPDSNGSSDTSLTAPGIVVGSAGYMAPEQVRGVAVDHRADIFSFGVVLYEMITGRRAFQRDTAVGTLAAIVESDPPSSTGDGSPQSRRLMRLARRCLEKSPAHRFQSARDLALVLQDESEIEPVNEEAAVQRPQYRLTALVGGAAVLVTALATWAWLSDRATSSGPAVVAAPVSFEISMPDGQPVRNTPAISAEGRVVAFVAGLGNDTNLYVRKFDVPTPRMVEGSRGAVQPFFSPDGRRLAYFAGGQLRVVSVGDGVSFVVCAVSGPRGGAWGQDDMIVFAPGVATGLSQVMPVAGALPKPLTTLVADELTHRFPVVLPGASAVLFTRQLKSGRTNVAALHAGAGAVEMVVDGAMAPRLPPIGCSSSTSEKNFRRLRLTPRPCGSPAL